MKIIEKARRKAHENSKFRPSRRGESDEGKFENYFEALRRESEGESRGDFG